MKGRRVFGIVAGLFVIFLLGVVIFIPWGGSKLGAATGAGIVLTNIVQVNWNSGAIAMSTNATNVGAAVGTNYGMTWIGITNQNVVSGTSVSNETILSNDGNATADFILTFSSNTFPNTSSVNWSAVFTNEAGGASSGNLRVTLAPSSFANIRLFISVPNTETNGAFIIFQCFSSNSNAVAEIGTAATNYVGYNGIPYGGDMGRYGAPVGEAFLSNAQPNFTNWIVTTIFANILISKTADISNAAPFIANTTIPFPGAIITYRLGFTNSGMVAGNSVRIIDTIPTNDLLYVNNSLKKGNYATTFANYGTLTALLDTPGDDDGSTNPTAADQIIFCPTNGVAPLTGGDIQSNDAGAYYYRTYLK